MPTYLWILSALSLGTCVGYVIGGTMSKRATEDELREQWAEGHSEGWEDGFAVASSALQVSTDESVDVPDVTERVMQRIAEDEDAKQVAINSLIRDCGGKP